MQLITSTPLTRLIEESDQLRPQWPGDITPACNENAKPGEYDYGHLFLATETGDPIPDAAGLVVACAAIEEALYVRDSVEIVRWKDMLYVSLEGERLPDGYNTRWEAVLAAIEVAVAVEAIKAA